MSGTIGDNVYRASGVIASAAASADFVLLNTTTVDGTATSVTVDGHYTADYINYMAQICISPDDTCNFKMQYTKLGDGTAITTSNYRRTCFFTQANSGTTTTATEKEWNTDHILMNNSVDTVVADDHNYNPCWRGQLWIYNPLDTTGSFKQTFATCSWDGDSSANAFAGFYYGYNHGQATTAMTGFKIETSTGTIDWGQIKLYGLK